MRPVGPRVPLSSIYAVGRRFNLLERGRSSRARAVKLSCQKVSRLRKRTGLHLELIATSGLVDGHVDCEDYICNC
jgi:hypothetical protein